jgi:hypothetical protein
MSVIILKRSYKMKRLMCDPIDNCYPCKHSEYNKKTGEMECWKDDTKEPFVVPRDKIHPLCPLPQVDIIEVPTNCKRFTYGRYGMTVEYAESIEKIIIVRKAKESE